MINRHESIITYTEHLERVENVTMWTESERAESDAVATELDVCAVKASLL
jgi:hypothetical protein